MSVNIYDTANQLEREFRQSEAFVALQNAFAAIENDAVAKKEFEAFKGLTKKFQHFQETGEQPTEQDLIEAEEISKRAQENALILELVKSEQAVSALIGELNNIITKPLSELYNV
ncbi:YlbF family regulator [Carnobacteriaceae bacterium zg-ZUI252]|nr:YlbF family regulator [Carnobacteriaceae bacterium zg-ZUI252]MBS4769954.1 YlbF family regulator [Carnobacteriaceae bacterium zg-ZUI240]QTU83361.1 YlbF family regulator [Carnobacteriaceae bacterium zg-C25]